MQTSKFELIINLQTARVMGFEVPGTLLTIADELAHLLRRMSPVLCRFSDVAPGKVQGGRMM
jgi:hypothetical protein